MVRTVLHSLSWLGLVVLLLAGLTLAACEDRAPAPGAGPDGKSAKPMPGQRIVCMSPAITQMLIELDCADRIVGLNQFDAAAAELDAKVVGDLYDFEYERLISVDPTDILLQPAHTGVPQKLRDMAEANHWRIHEYRLETIADVMRAMSPTGQGVPAVVNATPRGREVMDRFLRQLEQVGKAVDAKDPGLSVRTLVLVGVNPMTAAGPGTFIDEMLTLVRGRNAIVDNANAYPVLDKEAIVTLDPDVIVVVHTDPGAAPDRMPAALASLDVRAVNEGHVRWLADPHALLPTTSVPRVMAKLARVLHPEVADRIDRMLQENESP